ncbi:unnamed protein product [Cylindrotheca closterium]|nr:unnamed protein product [Cylindrotheca closterium]
MGDGSTSTSVHFQQPKQRSWNTSQVQVDTNQMEGDTTTAVSSLTAASPGGVHPFFLPSPSSKSGTSGSAKLPSLAGRGAHCSAAGSLEDPGRLLLGHTVQAEDLELVARPVLFPTLHLTNIYILFQQETDSLGDNHRCRSSLATRVTFQNVNGVLEDGDHEKQRQINSWLKDERVGIALLAEAKTYWPSISEGHGWNDRMRQATMKAKQKGFYLAVAYNKQQSRSLATTAFQWGGCIATVLSQVLHRAKEGGSNLTGLGRWAYVCLQGKKLMTGGGMTTPALCLM